MREGQSLNLTNERKRGRRDEPECSMRLQVHLRTGQIPRSRNGNVQTQLGSGGFRFSGNSNHSNDKLLGLELISRLHRRTRGLRRLRKIHGVDLANRTLDICPRRIIKTEIIEGSARIPQGEMNQPEKVARNENKVVIEEEKGVNTLARVERMNFSKEKRFSPRNNRTRRKLNTGKRTVFSWMIAAKTIKSRERVYYMDHKSKAVSLGGDVVGDGILCDCCSQVVSISEFEFHSWRQERFDSVEKISDPLRNICLGRGRGLCLLECMAEAWNKQSGFSSKFYNLVRDDDDEKSDDICRVCGEKGDLLCCDGCPSTFHQSCLGIQTIPEGEWHCMSCCCKFCGLRCGKTEITFEGLGPFEMSTECLVCERRFHRSCLKANGGNSSHNKRLSLCGNGCREIQTLVVIVDVGRVGKTLQYMGTVEDLLIRRGEYVPLDFEDPIFVCIRNNDLKFVFQYTPPSR
ncbi:hypothetical protein LR48_Vigan50s002400 [Vigna angularis]|uniref:PHD-type domain-containing protein n=1 Tax=Phaseolus angularis TaxID=3914 RepID=A0A0L9T4S8_PHAAN|nr:hypothetical protein LR48_Vigan50s002400 [Vigna angularis]